MALPHFTNIQSHNQNWEPVYKNLFEVEIFLPSFLTDKHPGGKDLLLENATNISLPIYPTLGVVDQRFKYSTRLFVGLPPETSIKDLGLTFNINQDDSNQMFTFRMIKDWYDLAWNNEDGSSNYKKNMLGEIILYQHDREGLIIRRISYHNCQIFKFSVDEALDWTATDIQKLTASWTVDWWEDFYF